MEDISTFSKPPLTHHIISNDPQGQQLQIGEWFNNFERHQLDIENLRKIDNNLDKLKKDLQQEKADLQEQNTGIKKEIEENLQRILEIKKLV